MAEELKPPASFGRPDINECMSYLKEKLRGAPMDGNEKRNRMYCGNLISALKKDYPNHDPVVGVKRLINIAFADSWHSSKAVGFEYFYYKKGTLIQLGLSQRPDKPRSPYTVIMPKNEQKA